MMRRLVHYLIRLFPADFRHSYGADMLATFDDHWRERPGLHSAVRILIDLAQSALQENLDRTPGPGGVMGKRVGRRAWRRLGGVARQERRQGHPAQSRGKMVKHFTA